MENLNPEQLSEVVSLLPDPAFILSSDGKYIAYLGGVDRQAYHDGSPLVGHYLKDVLPIDKALWFLSQIEKAISDNEIQIVEYDLDIAELNEVGREGPEGVLRYEGKIVPLTSKFDGKRAVLLLTRNITRRYKLEKQLRILSETDGLTGLFNRRFLLDTLEKYLSTRRYQSQAASLIFLDVDFFKEINDQNGHLVGDEVLKQICQRLETQLRTQDIAARIGGEEFAVFLPEACMEEATRVAERIRCIIDASPVIVGELIMPVTISAGITVLASDDDVSQVLTRADKALYQAKSLGRNQVRRA
ncbi:GGDEF domain-containing protein [Shewanella corallii]|uniref:diguanylate cyclase n=1 Tax=Shewanella corallii TaxID=560080 RepID=A0ABT0N1R8_9GAMM|nr:sensor domain-containing diguanylate cyclase [Shewanella corallii]MCL2912364.1 GGDEF domain-containing protein [Shewanella corallii]